MTVAQHVQYSWMNQCRVGRLTVRVGSLIANLLGEVADTRVDVASTSFSVQCLPSILAKPGGERIPRALNVVRHAFHVGSTGITLNQRRGEQIQGCGLRVVIIEVLVNVHHEVGGGPVRVPHRVERRSRTARNKGLGGRVVVTGKKDHLRCGTCETNRSHCGLNRSSPRHDVLPIPVEVC
jgi:hypothetical protein